MTHIELVAAVADRVGATCPACQRAPLVLDASTPVRCSAWCTRVELARALSPLVGAPVGELALILGDETWRKQLAVVTTREGQTQVARTTGNMLLIARHDYAMGSPRMDRLDGSVWLTGARWRPERHRLDDNDVTHAQALLDGPRWGLRVSREQVWSAILAVAADDAYDSAIDEAARLGRSWDGVDRLDTWLSTYMGAAQTQTVAMVGRWWMMSMAARMLRPGCDVHHVLVLEGDQGAGKSTALRVLAGDPARYLSGAELVVGGRGGESTLIKMRGKLIVEFAEFAAMRRAEIEAIKAFVTTSSDTYRMPYARTVEDVPRRCVFAATINPDGPYLVDETGNRRWWPVTVGVVHGLDIEALRRDRDQLLGEAVARVERGEPWWPTTRDDTRELAAAVAEREHGVDEWATVIRDWLRRRAWHPPQITVMAVATGALRMDPGRVSRSEQMRIGRCISLCGWRRRRSTFARWYEPPPGWEWDDTPGSHDDWLAGVDRYS